MSRRRCAPGIPAALLLLCASGSAARAEPPPLPAAIPPRAGPLASTPPAPPPHIDWETPTPLEKRFQERERVIREKWWTIASGAVLFAVNYSLMAYLAADGVTRSSEEAQPDLDVLYVPVAGPFIAMARGDVRFDDAGPIPLFCGLFQGLGLFGLGWGLTIQIPPVPGP